MKNWFSQLAQATEQRPNAIRLTLVFIAAAFLATVVFAYLALQNGTWQPYVVATAFTVFFATVGFSIASAQQNRVELAGILLIALMLKSRLNHH